MIMGTANKRAMVIIKAIKQALVRNRRFLIWLYIIFFQFKIVSGQFNNHYNVTSSSYDYEDRDFYLSSTHYITRVDFVYKPNSPSEGDSIRLNDVFWSSSLPYNGIDGKPMRFIFSLRNYDSRQIIDSVSTNYVDGKTFYDLTYLISWGAYGLLKYSVSFNLIVYKPVYISNPHINPDITQSSYFTYDSYNSVCEEHDTWLEYQKGDDQWYAGNRPYHFIDADGGTLVLPIEHVSASDLFDEDFHYRIVTGLDYTGYYYYTYGNIIGPYRFYDYPKLQIGQSSGNVVCSDKTIVLRGSYRTYGRYDVFTAALEAYIHNSWIPVSKALTDSIEVSYNDICGSDKSFLGKEIKLRTYKLFNDPQKPAQTYPDTIRGDTVKMVFIPIANVKTAAYSPTCTGVDDARIVIRPDGFSLSGADNPDNPQKPIELFVNIRLYGNSCLDPKYCNDTIVRNHQTYYYNNGATDTIKAFYGDSINVTSQHFGNFHLTAGWYKVRTWFNSDKANCPKELSFFISDPVPFSANVTAVPLPSNASYHIKTNESTGKAQFTFSGGTPPYSIVRNNVTLTTLKSSDLDSNGKYLMNISVTRDIDTLTYTLSDVYGCPYSGLNSAIFKRPSQIAISNTEATDYDCNHADKPGFYGQVECTFSGGVPDYTVQLCRTGNSAPLETRRLTDAGTVSFTGSNLISGYQYYIKITDGLNSSYAENSNTVSINEPLPLFLTTTSNSPTCLNGSDGSFSLTPSGGNGGYDYVFTKSGEAVARNNTQLPVGAYQIIMTDVKGCSFSLNNQVISQPSNPLTLTATYFKPVSCSVVSNGIVKAVVTNYRNTEADVIFKIGKDILSKTFDPVHECFYLGNLKESSNETIVVTDYFCQTSDTVRIPLRDPQFSGTNSTTTQAPCAGKYGTITVTAQHGEGTAYTYSLDGGGNEVLNSTTKIYTIKSGTAHTIRILDNATGCEALLHDVKAEVRNDSLKIDRTLDKSPGACVGSNTGKITVRKTDGTGIGPVNFVLLETGEPMPGTPATFKGLYSGRWYTVEAKDDSLCTDTVRFRLPVMADSLALSMINTKKAVCEGNSPTGQLQVSRYVNGSKKGYGYVWFKLGNDSVKSDTHTFANMKSGFYTIEARDSAGCLALASDSVRYSTNPVRLDTLWVVHQTCNETRNASIKLQASTSEGTAKEFRFVSGSDTTAWHTDTITYHVQSAGKYTFTVTDRNNCGTSRTDSIKNLKHAPKPLAGNISAVACSRALNGELPVYSNENGSKPPYTYTMGTEVRYAGSGTSQVKFPGLAKGYYVVTAKDALGCLDTARFVVGIHADSVHIGRVDTIKASCVRAGDGKAKVIGLSFDQSAIAKKYKFTCNGQSLWGDSVWFTHLPVKKGLYTVTVSDTFGCTHSAAFAMGVRVDSVRLSGVWTANASCPGYSNGILKLRRSAGHSSYRFALTASDPGYNRTFYTNDTSVWVKGLPQGIYAVSVTDTAGCQDRQENMTITQPDTLQFLTSYYNYIHRIGQAEGRMYAQVYKGNKKYNFQWYKGATLIHQGQAKALDTLSLNNQLAGTYLLRVQDTARCQVGTTGWLEKQFILAEPQKDLTLVVKRNKPVTCYGMADGEFEVAGQGGWGSSYTYGPDALHLYADPVFRNYKAGTLNVVVKDTSGVTYSQPVTVTQPDPLNAALDAQTDANCFGSADGSIHANITGGNYPYYFISAGNNQWIKGNELKNLAVGTYTVQVRDTLHCTYTLPLAVILRQPSAIRTDSALVKETRCGFANGSVKAYISGGVPGYTFLWNNESGNTVTGTGSSASGLLSGAYRLWVTDAHQCRKYFDFQVSDSTNLTIDRFDTHTVSCWGYADGGASIALSKGNPPYTVTWPDSTHQLSVQGLRSGAYTVRIDDTEKCKLFRQFTIGTPDSISIESMVRSNPLCKGRDNGSLSITGTGGFGGYEYTWENDHTGNSLSGLAPGIYKLKITDSHHCFNRFAFSLQYENFNKPSLGNDLTLCQGNSVTLDPGVFSGYQWTSDIGVASRDPQLTVTRAGQYYVEVKDKEGCIGYDTIRIAMSQTQLTGKLLLSSDIVQGDTVMIFEASWPLPDSVRFSLQGCKVLSSGTYFREVVFADTGTYTIGLTSYLNDCSDMRTEHVQIKERASLPHLKLAKEKLIQELTVSPNPNDGSFQALISLSKKSDISLKLASLGSGYVVDSRQFKGSDLYTIQYHVRLAPGAYILYLEAGGEAKARTVVVGK